MSAAESLGGLSRPFKSLQEARKEAQKAILRLWPMGVKYQNYIEEGFDEKLIKGLFRDLHLDVPKSPTDSPTAPAQEARSQDSTKAGKSSDVQQLSATGTKDAPDQPAKGEERKDRIARLLAAKAAKTPAAAPKTAPPATEAKQAASSAPSQDSAPAPSPSAPPKTKTWGEKERLLQQKIAALQKSREAQAQKSAAAEAADAESAQAGSSGLLGPPQAKTASGPAPVSIPTGPRASHPQVAPSLPQPPRPPIPGLALSPNAQPNTSAQKKRPVAADFVEYSSAPGPRKRPFGQARKESSLIIDVTDDESDEGEMDMDIASPVDEPSSIQSSGVPAQRGPSIRDFPPLSDSSQRQMSGPLPSRTPPTGPTNKRRETELDLKEKEIQEMRRKIALAEARRKAKQSSGGSVTPKQAGQTPELKENEASRQAPPERADPAGSSDQPGSAAQKTPEAASTGPSKPPASSHHLDAEQRAGRRGRIVNLDLPRVESSLEEKLNRLKQLRDEEARLQAEIDRGYAEKQKLTEELEQLDTSAESPQANGLGSDSTPGNAFIETNPRGNERQKT